MPATGTPEPGGLFWDETLNIIKTAAKYSNIVGADINELSPIKGFNSCNFLVAKLAYKILAYKFLLWIIYTGLNVLSSNLKGTSITKVIINFIDRSPKDSVNHGTLVP